MPLNLTQPDKISSKSKSSHKEKFNIADHKTQHRNIFAYELINSYYNRLLNEKDYKSLISLYEYI